MVAAVAVWLGVAAGAPALASAAAPAPFRPGAVVLGFQPGVPAERQRAIESGVGASAPRRLGPVTQVGHRHGLTVAARVRGGGAGVLKAVRALRLHREVRYAEPDYLMHEDAAPNDPSFGLQWGSSNTGQLVNGASGTPGADDRALAAWGVSTGSRSVVIGETDSGVDYGHPDLAANIWSNPGGIGGCAASTHGYNVLAGSCDPMDDEIPYHGHGTHVAGILGAVGNNAAGVAGMNWSTTILPVKWLDSSGNGSTSGLISALNWLVAAKQAGVNVRVVNDSATYVGTAYSQALADEIDALGSNDILFVTAAGNTGDNNDDPAYRRYPCGYDRPTEICVTASNQSDQLPSWANYGAATVDLAAPGDNVYSTLRGGGYGYISGGSMASPQVAGAAALVLSRGYMSAPALRDDLLSNVDPLPALAGRVRTGGRLDVCKALAGCATPPAQSTFGKTTVGASTDSFALDRKRVSRYSLGASGSVSKLSAYLAPTSTAGQQTLRGVVYADAGGSPGALLATSNELVFHSTDAAGWYDLTLPSPVTLAPGSYWIGVLTGAGANVAGFRWDSVPGSRVYDNNAYSAGPSDPFGALTGTDAEQMSLYASYAPSSAPTSPPVNTTPTVTGLSPSSGSRVGGQTVTITGSGLSNTSTVDFGSAAATNLRQESDSQVTVTAPSGTGTVDVTVKTPNATSATGSADRYVYAPPPSLSGIAPSSGPQAGDTTVTITGSGLASASTVHFGSTPATNVRPVSDSELTATAPPGAGTVGITVSSTDGTSGAIGYTYSPTPSGSSPTPSGSSPPPSTSPPVAHLTDVTMRITGALRYRLRASVSARVVRIARDRHGRLVAVRARLSVRGVKGATATLVYSLAKSREAWAGSIHVIDRRANVDERFSLIGAPSLARGGIITGSARAHLRHRPATLRFQLRPVTALAAASSRTLSVTAAAAVLVKVF